MTRPFSVTVTKKDIADEIYIVILQYETRFPYTGEAIEPQWEVVYSLSEKYYLTMGEDYTVAYSGNINAGTATATYTGIGDYYTGTRTVEFTIQPQAATLNVSSTERTWSKDMSLDESDLRALFTVNDAGGDTAAASFTVSPAKLGVSIEMPDYTYGGTVPTPALTPETSGLTVAWFYKGADGEEHPWENITGATLTAGGYTIIARIEASALYEAAELTSTFTVNKAAAPEIDWPEVTQGITYGQAVSEAALSATEDAYGTFAWEQPDAILNAGEQAATLVYAPRDTANYDYTGVELMREIAISIAPRDVYTLAAAPIPAQTYTGGPIYPAVSLWHGETKLVMGVDYTLSYQDNVNVGVGIITVAGMGNYAGTRLLFFDIVPPRAEEEEKPSGGSGGSTGNGGETAESTGEAQQDRLVVDTTGAAMPYTYSTVEGLDEETGAVIARSASTSPFCKVICESKAISQPFCRNATGASPSAAS